VRWSSRRPFEDGGKDKKPENEGEGPFAGYVDGLGKRKEGQYGRVTVSSQPKKRTVKKKTRGKFQRSSTVWNGQKKRRLWARGRERKRKDKRTKKSEKSKASV